MPTVVIEAEGECLRCGRCCVDSCEFKAARSCDLHCVGQKPVGCSNYPRGALVQDMHDGCGYTPTVTLDVPAGVLHCGWFGHDEPVFFDRATAMAGGE